MNTIQLQIFFGVGYLSSRIQLHDEFNPYIAVFSLLCLLAFIGISVTNPK